jgi:acyl-CoA dehydrogenase
VSNLPRPDYTEIREAVRALCADFPDSYWRSVEEAEEYPTQFVDTISKAGWLSLLIPAEYGGGGGGIVEASVVLEEIHRSGGNANAAHAQMYTMGSLLRHGSAQQKQRYLPGIAAGDLRLQAFGITEPEAGSNTLAIRTRAVRDGDDYVVTGQKVYTSRIANSDLMLLLVRTAEPSDVRRPRDCLSLLLVDLREAGSTVSFTRIPVMFNHHTYSVFIDELRVPAANLIGEEGQGFRYVLDGMNAERILISSEAIGDGLFFVDRASKYASTRNVFGQPIGANQGVQFPIAEAYADVMAASLMRFEAAAKFDSQLKCGPEANMAKLLASRAAWRAANASMVAYGGNGMAREYGIERKFRESKLLEIAPISNNLVLAFIGQQILKMPRSY